MSDPICRSLRELLGVYVVGAIEPAERAAVDAHLDRCHDCREELAGLAVLPALLHRVALADAERLLGADTPGDGDPADPSPDLLPSLLRQVAARRRSRRVRAALAVAAVALAVVGGTAAVTSALSQRVATPPVAHRTSQDQASARADSLVATVRYGKWRSGTEMFVRVNGLTKWSRCTLWVMTKSGHKDFASAWMVGPRRDTFWYRAAVNVPKSSISKFVLTTATHQMVTIPAT